MAEEQNYEQSSAPPLCTNNCGFFANPATMNLCSKCYREHLLKEIQRQQLEAFISSTDSVSQTSAPSLMIPPAADSVESSVSETASSRPGRCEAGECRKRVDLIGFNCKCGATFCINHRFSEEHSCKFDFKSVGRKAIAEANPNMKKPKLDKIEDWPSSKPEDSPSSEPENSPSSSRSAWDWL